MLKSKTLPVLWMLFLRRIELCKVALSRKMIIFLVGYYISSASLQSLEEVSNKNCSTILASTEPSIILLVMTLSVVIAESNVNVKTFCLMIA